jgi:hypothetical protein
MAKAQTPTPSPKPAPKKPVREATAYNWRSRANLKRGRAQ